ncbi:MAG: cytidine deaminase [bacterium]|nr:cytidine deaminase [bacterium]
MFKYKVVNSKKVYSLDKATCQKMLQTAGDHLKNTFPHPNGYAVAVLTEKGSIYPGVSYGSETYTLTMHSEAAALVHAAIHGETKIIAITGPNCHICKQLIYESSLRSKIDTLIVLKEKGKIKQIPISKLMPYPWPLKPKL